MPKRVEISSDLLRSFIVDQKLSAQQIANRLSITYPTVRKRAKEKGLLAILDKNGRARQSRSNYVDGRASYRKHKKDRCQQCNSRNVRLEIHHIKPVVYNSTWSTIIKGDHSPSNLVTLCNSCHQKTHYREHRRKPMRSDGRRFYSNIKDK